MYWTRCSLIFTQLRFPYNLEIAQFQEEMVVGNLFEVEAAQLLEPDNS